MSKRLIALVLAIVMGITIVPTQNVKAKEIEVNDSQEVITTNDNKESPVKHVFDYENFVRRGAPEIIEVQLNKAGDAVDCNSGVIKTFECYACDRAKVDKQLGDVTDLNYQNGLKVAKLMYDKDFKGYLQVYVTGAETLGVRYLKIKRKKVEIFEIGTTADNEIMNLVKSLAMNERLYPEANWTVIDASTTGVYYRPSTMLKFTYGKKEQLGVLYECDYTVEIDSEEKTFKEIGSTSVNIVPILEELKILNDSVSDNMGYADILLRYLGDTYYTGISDYIDESNPTVTTTFIEDRTISKCGCDNKMLTIGYNNEDFLFSIKNGQYDLTQLFKTLCDKDNSLDFKNAPYLKELVQALNIIIEKKEKKKSDKELETSVDVLSYLNPQTPYEWWCYAILEYITSNQYTYVKKDTLKGVKAGYDVTEYKSKSGSLDDLTKARIQAFFQAVAIYNKLPEKVSLIGSEEKSVKTVINSMSYSNLDKSVVLVNTSHRDRAFPFESVLSIANEVATNIEQSSDMPNDPNGLNRLALLDSLVKYEAARMYGAEVGSTETMSLEHCALADKFALVVDSNGILVDEEKQKALNYDYLGLSEMKNMQGVIDTQEAYNAYMNIVYNMTCAATWASDMVKFEDTAKTKRDSTCSIEVLKQWMSEHPDSSEIDSSDLTSNGISSWITISLSICRALEYLGMDAFTPELKVIQELYNDLIQYEDLAVKVENINAEDEALGMFFNVEESYFTDDYLKGVEMSALYKPFETNMYSLNSLPILDDADWVRRFHYPFGFYRKALYIDNDRDAAVNRYVKQDSTGARSVATLNDLLQPEKDIVLYIDSSFYNINELADAVDKVYTSYKNSEESGSYDLDEVSEDGAVETFFRGLSHDVAENIETDVEAIMKTGGHTTYSDNVRKSAIGNYGDNSFFGSNYVLRDEDINKYLKVYDDKADSVDALVYDDYTPMQPYAVVSAIYRQKSLYNILKAPVRSDEPVFVSSPNLAGTVGVGKSEFNTIYNYAMLKNLEEALPLDVDVTIDMNSPLFMDIYGNIITESGYIVIPAASNATLCNYTKYSPATIGFIYLYNKGNYLIPAGYNNASKYISGFFEISEERNAYVFSAKRVNNVYIDFNNFPVSDQGGLQTIKNIMQDYLYQQVNYLPFANRVYLITEVLRGAPIGNIDYKFEGLKGISNIDKTGIYAAFKLEELSNALMSKTNGNSLIELPNLAFMEGVEYVILFLYKIVFIICLIFLFYRLYIDAAQGILGLRTMTSFIISMFMFLVIIFAIPEVLDISYYQVNKKLLQDEVEYIEMLNLEKEASGKEIGITKVDSPETETELYLKVDDLSVPWYVILDDVLFKSTFKTISEIYDEELEDSLLKSLPGMIQKGNGLYVSVDTLFESSVIEYDSKSNSLISTVIETPYASYVTPYYAILDLLVDRVNEYNSAHVVKEYEVNVQARGRVRTKGLVTPYFTSEYFMTSSQDVLGLKAIYDVDTTLVESNPFSEGEIKQMSYSMWYRDKENFGDFDTMLDEIDNKARVFVANKHNLLGKVSDETFLKVMALSMAVEHNDALQVPAASAIEIYDIDTRDVIRLSLANRQLVMTDCTKSYARFVYDNAGVLGIITVAMLMIVYFIASFAKPVMIFIILASMIAGAVFRQTVNKDAGGAVEGVIITGAILSGINVVYAVLLKVTVAIPQLGVTMPVSCLIQVALQVLYICILAFFTSIVMSNWKTVGFDKYTQAFYKVITHVKNNKVYSRNTEIQSNDFNKLEKSKNRRHAETGRDILEQMQYEDEKRRKYRGKK